MLGAPSHCIRGPTPGARSTNRRQYVQAEDASLWDFFGSISLAKGTANELKLRVSLVYADTGGKATFGYARCPISALRSHQSRRVPYHNARRARRIRHTAIAANL